MAIDLVKPGSEDTPKSFQDISYLADMLQEFPEFSFLVGKAEPTPEKFGEQPIGLTYGSMLFPAESEEQLVEFERTALSLLLYKYIVDDDYESFTQCQSGERKLAPNGFAAIREMILSDVDTDELKRLLQYYVIINDLGKTEYATDRLTAHGIEFTDHDDAIAKMAENGMLPSLGSFSEDTQSLLIDTLRYGINIGQLIQGECVAASCLPLANLSEKGRSLMLAEGLLDIGGASGAKCNTKGTPILDAPTVENILMARRAIQKGAIEGAYSRFLADKVETHGISITSPDMKKSATRLTLMMRLATHDEMERAIIYMISSDQKSWLNVIDEMSRTGFEGSPATLLYYAPATLANAIGYYEEQGDAKPNKSALLAIIPFFSRVFDASKKLRNPDGGVYQVDIAEAAKVAGENPGGLTAEFVLDVTTDNSAVLRFA